MDKTFKITFRDVSHFYTIIRHLNTLVGHGNWRMSNGKVLRKLKRGKLVSRNIIIFDAMEMSNEDIEDLKTYLTLI